MSPDAYDFETSLTALVPNPKFVAAPIRPVVELRRPEIHIPVGPKSNATNLEFTMDIRIFKTCTHPNSELVFSPSLKSLFSSDISTIYTN